MSNNNTFRPVVGCVFVAVTIRQSADSQIPLPQLYYFTTNDKLFTIGMFTFTVMVQLYVLSMKYESQVASLFQHNDSTAEGLISADRLNAEVIEFFGGDYGLGQLFDAEVDTDEDSVFKFLQACTQVLWISWTISFTIYTKALHFVWRADTNLYCLFGRSQNLFLGMGSGGLRSSGSRWWCVARCFRMFTVLLVSFARVASFGVCLCGTSLCISLVLPDDTMFFNRVSDYGFRIGCVLSFSVTLLVLFTEMLALFVSDWWAYFSLYMSGDAADPDHPDHGRLHRIRLTVFGHLSDEMKHGTKRSRCCLRSSTASGSDTSDDESIDSAGSDASAGSDTSDDESTDSDVSDDDNDDKKEGHHNGDNNQPISPKQAFPEEGGAMRTASFLATATTKDRRHRGSWEKELRPGGGRTGRGTKGSRPAIGLESGTNLVTKTKTVV
jgi:hypothetical protein